MVANKIYKKEKNGLATGEMDFIFNKRRRK